MNLFFLKYNLREEMKKNNYNWQEILFALENQIVTVEDVIEYASYIINENTMGFDIVLAITCLHSYEDIYPYLHQLTMLEDSRNIADIKEKWLYLILKWLYEKRNDVENTLEIVEEIYELFDYPDNITSFVRYMPSETGNLGSVELNRERLFKNWANYLELFEEEHLL